MVHIRKLLANNLDLLSEMKFKDNEIFDHINKNPKDSRVFKNVLDYNEILTWEEIENHLNNSYLHSDNLSLISNCGSKFFPSKNSYPYSQTETYKTSQVFEFINKGFSFILTNMNRFNSTINSVFGEIESSLDSKIIMDFHVYGGLGSESKSFLTHSDKSSNIIMQIDGESDWKVFDGNFEEPITMMESDESRFNLIVNTTLKPGDCLYIPAGSPHKCSPKGKRMSISCCWDEILNNEFISVGGISYRSYIGKREWHTFEK